MFFEHLREYYICPDPDCGWTTSGTSGRPICRECGAWMTEAPYDPNRADAEEREKREMEEVDDEAL